MVTSLGWPLAKYNLAVDLTDKFKTLVHSKQNITKCTLWVKGKQLHLLKGMNREKAQDDKRYTTHRAEDEGPGLNSDGR